MDGKGREGTYIFLTMTGGSRGAGHRAQGGSCPLATSLVPPMATTSNWENKRTEATATTDMRPIPCWEWFLERDTRACHTTSTCGLLLVSQNRSRSPFYSSITQKTTECAKHVLQDTLQRILQHVFIANVVTWRKKLLTLTLLITTILLLFLEVL